MQVKKFVIGITGTPGSGKSSFAKRLHANLVNSSIFEVNDFVKLGNAVSGKDADGTIIADIKKLSALVNKSIKESKSSNIILVGHLVQELDVKLDMMVVMRVKINELDKRLKLRGYSKPKRAENLVSESLDYCGSNSIAMCKNVYELMTNSDKNIFLSAIDSKKINQTPIKKFHIAGPQPQLKDLLKFIKNNRNLGL